MPDEASEKAAPTGDSVPSPAPAVSEKHDAVNDAVSAPASGEVAENATPTEASVKRRKKKRKQRAAEEPAEPAAPAVPALTLDGRERPLFVLAFPADPELDRLVQAFEAGNYAYVREHAPKLAQGASSPRVREAAAELARRIEPDPLVKVLLGLSVALFVALAVWAYKTHAG